MRSLQIEDDMEDIGHLVSISMEERVGDTGVTDRIRAKKTSSTPTTRLLDCPMVCQKLTLGFHFQAKQTIDYDMEDARLLPSIRVGDIGLIGFGQRKHPSHPQPTSLRLPSTNLLTDIHYRER